MTEHDSRQIRRRAFLRWLFAAALVFAVVWSGVLSGMAHAAGLFYLAVGCAAVALMGFSCREIGAAFRHAAGRPGTRQETKRSAHVWEAAARNAWILGVLGSTLNLTMAVSSESGGIADVSHRVIRSLIVTLYGLVLAVVCLAPAIKLAVRAERAPTDGASEQAPAGSLLLERVTGYALFATVLGLALALAGRSGPQNEFLSVTRIVFHGPAALVVFGGAIALALFMGRSAGARAWTLGFGLTGLIALLMGLIQALLGFVHSSIQEIAAAIAFIVSASAYALLGLAVAASPLEDREVMEGRVEGPGTVSRMFWAVFPLLVFVFLLLAFIMLIMPMTRRA